MRRTIMVGVAAMALLAVAYAELGGAFPGSLDDPAIQYDTRPLHDPIAKLNARIRDGAGAARVRKAFQAICDRCSKRSTFRSNRRWWCSPRPACRRRIISPSNPRALYFNDSVAVGWVRGEPFVEVAAEDPEQGVVFYTLDQTATEKPQFERAEPLPALPRVAEQPGSSRIAGAQRVSRAERNAAAAAWRLPHRSSQPVLGTLGRLVRHGQTRPGSHGQHGRERSGIRTARQGDASGVARRPVRNVGLSESATATSSR